MNTDAWDYTQQDNDDAWIRKMLEDEEIQAGLEDQQKAMIEAFIKMHQKAWRKRDAR